MRWLAPALIVALTACNDTVNIEGIDGLPTDDIAFSFNARDSGRNVAGGTTTATTVVLTDREDFCDELASAGSIESMPDVFAVQLFAFTNSDPNSVDSNAPLGELLFDPSGGEQAVAARVLRVQGGEVRFDGFSENLIDLQTTTPGDFNINGVSSSPNGTNFSGNYETRLGGDRSNPDSWDTDFTDDGVSDYRRISGTIDGRFSGAKDCDALFTFVDVPDVEPEPDP